MKLELADGTILELDRSDLTIEVEPTQDGMLSFFLGDDNLFEDRFIGYWADPVQWNGEDKEWLCVENESINISEEEFALFESEYNRLRLEGKLNKNKTFTVKCNEEEFFCFVIDVRFACKALTESTKWWGQKRLDTWDGYMVDYGAQMALYQEKKWT